MSKRKKNSNNGGVMKMSLCHFSKSNNENKKLLLLGCDFCPSRDYMFTLLQQGNIEDFKKLAPMFVLQVDVDSLENTFLHRVVLTCSKTGYSSIKNMLDLMLKEAPDMVNIKNQKTGATPLMLACQEAKCSQLILRLVEANPDTVTLEDINGNIPLLEFIRNVTVGQKSGEIKLQECCLVIETLLNYGENVKHENKANKDDALKCLLVRENLNKDHFKSIVKILFQHGAKLVSKSGEHVFKYITKFQSIIIDVASQYCPEEFSKKDKSEKTILDYLFQDKIINEDTGHFVSDESQSNMKCNEYELFQSLKIIFKNKETILNGNKIITLAANRKCDFKIIKFLITKTSNFTIQGTRDKLLTQYATNAENVTELLKLGCNPNAITYDSKFNKLVCNYNFALFTASNARNKGAIIKLIKEGTDPLIIIQMKRHDRLESDKFTAFITEDECTNVLKYVLDSSQLTKTSENSESLTKFYILVISQIYIHYNSEKNVNITKEKLKIVLNKIQSENLEMKVRVSHVDNSGILFLETFGIFLRNPWILSIHTYMLRKAHEFIKIMLELGYTVIQNQNNIVSPLTELLMLWGRYPLDFVLPFMNLLIEEGKVNVESNICANTDYLIAAKLMDPTLLIPDALTVALRSHNIDVVEKLLSHWWGPPIALTAFLERLINYEKTPREKYLCTEMYQLLQKYGDVPYGTTLLPASVWNQMKLWKKRMIKKFDRGLVSPASLQELSKYVVRHSLAARALQPDVSLPQLLHQVLPPLLRSVVIH